MNKATPIWLKRLTMLSGLTLVIISIPFAINLLCIFPLTMLNAGDHELMQYGVASLTLLLVTLGAGLVALRQGDSALKNQSSNPLRLPSPILLLAVFLPLLVFGLIFQASGPGAVFFPLFLWVTAILPPLWALAWMIPHYPVPKKSDETNTAQEDSGDVHASVLTWRRGLLAFTGGATLSVFLALLLEILVPVIVLSLVFNLTDVMAKDMSAFLRALSNTQVARALANPVFIFVLLQVAVIAPIVEEFAKPLVTLPLLRGLSRQEAFWLGALAGAGFAVMENVIYATAGVSLWAGILIVRALGGALHPLGSGLVAAGWRDVLNQEPDAHPNWWRRFGMAAAIHAAWNGGSLLLITLGGAGFFGQLPRDLNIIGLSASGSLLAFLLILGIAALWAGRAYGHNRPFLGPENSESTDVATFIPSDRAVAIWALACLVAIVPAGIAGLKLWLR